MPRRQRLQLERCGLCGKSEPDLAFPEATEWWREQGGSGGWLCIYCAYAIARQKWPKEAQKLNRKLAAARRKGEAEKAKADQIEVAERVEAWKS